MGRWVHEQNGSERALTAPQRPAIRRSPGLGWNVPVKRIENKRDAHSCCFRVSLSCKSKKKTNKKRATIWKDRRTTMGWEVGMRRQWMRYVYHALEDESAGAVSPPSPSPLPFHLPFHCSQAQSWEEMRWRMANMRDKVSTLWIASSCSRSRQSRVCPSPSCMRSIGSLWGRPWNEPWGGGCNRREKASSFLVLHLSAGTP